MTRPMFAMLCANNVNRTEKSPSSSPVLRAPAPLLRFTASAPDNGPSRDDPRIYEFFTPYETMYRELKSENAELFKRNGVLSMLERDMLTKKCPQRWQDLSVKELQGLDVVLC
ncbi:RNA polymerase II subunit A C-terminal domain phosphatase, partial [Phytophthora palmivora]